LYSLVGFAVPSALLLVATPLLVRRLGTADFGLWTISIAALGLMGVLELGLGTAVSKYVAEYTSRNDVEALSATATAAFVAYIGIGILTTIPLILGAPWLAELLASPEVSPSRVETVVRLVSLGLVPMLLNSGGLAVAAGLQRFEVLMLATAGQNGLTILTAMLVAYLGGSVEDVILGSVCVLWAVALTSVAIGFRFLRRLGAEIVFSRAYARQTLSYVMFTGATSLGTLVFGTVDRITVGAVLGLQAVTYYAVSIGIAGKLLSLADVATRPLMPASSALLGQSRAGVAYDYLRRSTTAVAAASALVATLLILGSGPFMRWWMGNQFAGHALPTFRVLIVVCALVAVAAPGYHVANGTGYPWICAATTIVGGLATIGLIVVLGRSLGLVGAAWANAAYCVTLVIPLYVAARLKSADKLLTRSGPLGDG
jgi:O-antigen/teichoic acid export membrane protein